MASVLFLKNKRKYIYAIYTFARMADEIADSKSLNSKEKLNQLNELESLLNTVIVPQEEVKNMIIALRDTIEKENLGITDLLNLLKAFKQDSVKSRYKSFDELQEYSKYSANPIGRLVLKLSGYNESKNPEMFNYSDNICTGLQLINFWQDVSRDTEIDRIYIPEEIMKKYSYSYEDLYNKKYDERYKNILKELVIKSEEIYERGRPIVCLLKGRLKLELKAIYNGGNRILQKIKEIEFNTLHKRVKLYGKDKLIILFKSVFLKID
ncbi:MAG: squalene synthase HpnC [Ignavibacteria bacterium]|nr:squalene synthase HpnC [Ignavibacteria bacterium]